MAKAAEVPEERVQWVTFEVEGDAPSVPTGDTTITSPTVVDVRPVDVLLFTSDIQNFTALSERLPPDELAPIIGSWYRKAEGVLDANGAILDRFDGDSVLAHWWETGEQARLLALKTAAAMQRACKEVRRQHARILKRERLSFNAGSAVHLGAAAYGPFSSHVVTLLGDAVNVAFRMEALTRELGERVLVSAEVLEGWADGQKWCRHLGKHRLKGRSQKVELYVLDRCPECEETVM